SLRCLAVSQERLAVVAHVEVQSTRLRVQITTQDQPQGRPRRAKATAIGFEAKTICTDSIFERERFVKAPGPWHIQAHAPDVKVIQRDLGRYGTTLPRLSRRACSTWCPNRVFFEKRGC